MTNRDRLEELFRAGKIAVERGALFDRHLPPKPAAFDFDRVEGMLLGVAVGDGLGITTEGRLPGERIAAHGRIRDYLPTSTWATGGDTRPTTRRSRSGPWSR